MNEPSLPRKCTMPKRFQSGEAAHFFLQIEKDPFRHKYFEAQDLVISCVKTCFHQPGYKNSGMSKNYLLKVCSQTMEINVMNFHT